MSRAPKSPDLLAAALELIEAEGWSAYAPLQLAASAEVGLAEACMQLPDQGAVLAALGRRADAAMLDIAADELLEMTPKERVFELIMRRFEALEFARPALRRFGRETSAEAWLCGLGSLHLAMKRVVEAGGLAGSGLRGVATGAAVTSAYLRVGRLWLDDDTPDRARTLAALNERLDEIERFLG